MKLYTEEQMAKVWMAGQKYWETSGASITFEELLEHEKPIKLPSDEKIKSYSDRYSTMHEDVSDKLGKYLVSAIHIDVAK